MAQDPLIEMRLSGLNPLPGLAAIRVDQSHPGQVKELAGLRKSELDALASGGWLVHKRAGPDRKSLYNPVYRSHDGRLLVATGGMTVGFAPDVPRSEVESTLRRYGYEVRRQLAMLDNTFAVAPLGGAASSPATEVVGRLAKETCIEFVEPTLEEVMGGR